MSRRPPPLGSLSSQSKRPSGAIIDPNRDSVQLMSTKPRNTNWALGATILVFLLGACSMSIGILIGHSIKDCGTSASSPMQCEITTPVTQAVEQIDLSAAMISISNLVANGSSPTLVRTAQARVCDTLNEVAVTMATGNVHRFRVEGCTHYVDGRTIVTGIGGQQLVYPANGGTPYLLATHAQRSSTTPAASSRRQLAASTASDFHSQLSQLGDAATAAHQMTAAAQAISEMAAVLHRRQLSPGSPLEAEAAAEMMALMRGRELQSFNNWCVAAPRLRCA